MKGLVPGKRDMKKSKEIERKIEQEKEGERKKEMERGKKKAMDFGIIIYHV